MLKTLAFSAAVKNAKRWFEDYEAGILGDSQLQKKRFRSEGGGRKLKAPDVRHALFDRFVNMFGLN